MSRLKLKLAARDAIGLAYGPALEYQQPSGPNSAAKPRAIIFTNMIANTKINFSIHLGDWLNPPIRFPNEVE